MSDQEPIQQLPERPEPIDVGISPGSRYTKQLIQERAEEFVVGLLDSGFADPLSLYIQIRTHYEFASAVMKLLEDEAIDKATTYPNEQGEFQGVKFQVKGGPTRYDYSHDSVWESCKATEDRAALERKGREAFLRTLKQELADTETGEIIRPAVVTSLGKVGIAITIPPR